MLKYDKTFGIYSNKIPYVPTPKELMRRMALIGIIDSLTPGYTIDIGCGSGAYLYDLNLRGFSGKAVDSSMRALSVAKSIAKMYDCNFTFDSQINFNEVSTYDYLLALEVIEHLDYDQSMIKKFKELLKPNGRIILSVPAHKRLWSQHDLWAGHYRRYDRSDLINLIESSGFKILSLLSYGYPSINLMTPVRKTLAFFRMNRITKISAYNINEATKESGVYRSVWPRIHWIYLNRLAKYFWIMIYNIQRRYYTTDKGEGYLVSAEKII